MNKIILTGRYTNKPEIRYTSSNKPVAIFTLAVNRDFKNSDGNYDTDFFNCKSFINAETIAKYCDKGDLVLVDGRVQNRTYEDNEGNKKYITEVICNRVEFLSKVNKSQQKEINKSSSPDEDIYAEFGDSIEISDDDIAF